MKQIKKNTVKELFLVKQGLWKKTAFVSQKNGLINLLKSLGLVQLDSINVLDRNHYLVFFSRLGAYKKTLLDELIWSDHKAVEAWAHVASFLPAEYYHYLMPLMELRKKMPLRPNKIKAMGGNPEKLLEQVYKQICLRGPLSSRNFPKLNNGKRQWWHRKPERRALELLFRRGDLMINRRVNFEPYYDLPCNVLSNNHLKKSFSWAEWESWVTRKSLEVLGIATISHLADYFRQSKSTIINGMDYLVKGGVAVEVSVPEWVEPSYILCKDLELVDSVGSFGTSDATTFLSPFDNLLWHRDRVKTLFDFQYRAEMYTPADERKYGYYVMPILHCGALVGRLDPRVNRANRQLDIHSIHLENGQRIDRAFISALRKSLEDMALFTGCSDIRIIKSKPERLKKELG